MTSTDFASSLQGMLTSEELIRLKPVAPTADISGLINLLQVMAQKIEQQEVEIARQHEVIDSLVHEVSLLRSATEDTQVLRRDMKRLINETETLVVQQRMQNQRMDRLRGDVDELSLAGRPPPSTAAVAPQAHPAAPQSPPRGAAAHASAFPVSGVLVASPTQKAVTGVNQQRPVVGLDLVDAPQGLVVLGVKPGSPAALGGLESGDVIMAVNSEECNFKQGFLALLERSSIGQPLDIAFFRDGHRRMTRIYVVSGAAETRSPERR